MSSLSVAHKQMVEIAKALSNDLRISDLDEPTASLSAGEVEHLFKNLLRLREQGISVIYVSHRLEELPVLADRVTVFRDGRYIVTLPIAEAPKRVIIRHMVGREVQSNRRPPRAGEGELLRAEGLCGRVGFSNVSFTLRRGEILGFAGLAGAGRTETARAIFGVDKLTAGRLYVDGKLAAIKSPRDAIAGGMAFITENRKEEGLVLGLSVLENLTMAIFGKTSKFGVISHRVEKEELSKAIRRMGVKCASATQRVRALSGGNQQKVVIGKWLSTGALDSHHGRADPRHRRRVEEPDLRPHPRARRRGKGNYPHFVGDTGDPGAQRSRHRFRCGDRRPPNLIPRRRRRTRFLILRQSKTEPPERCARVGVGGARARRSLLRFQPILVLDDSATRKHHVRQCRSGEGKPRR